MVGTAVVAEPRVAAVEPAAAALAAVEPAAVELPAAAASFSSSFQ